MIDRKYIRLGEDDEDDGFPVFFPVLSVCEEDEDFKVKEDHMQEEMPILALRNMILFPINSLASTALFLLELWETFFNYI